MEKKEVQETSVVSVDLRADLACVFTSCKYFVRSVPASASRYGATGPNCSLCGRIQNWTTILRLDFRSPVSPAFPGASRPRVSVPIAWGPNGVESEKTGISQHVAREPNKQENSQLATSNFSGAREWLCHENRQNGEGKRDQYGGINLPPICLLIRRTTPSRGSQCQQSCRLVGVVLFGAGTATAPIGPTEERRFPVRHLFPILTAGILLAYRVARRIEGFSPNSENSSSHPSNTSGQDIAARQVIVVNSSLHPNLHTISRFPIVDSTRCLSAGNIWPSARTRHLETQHSKI